MIRFVLRLANRLGLRWLIASAIGRYVIRRYGRTTVERAGRDLEASARQRLPAPVADRIPALPAEAVQLGGSAVVAGRAARGAVATTRRAGRLAGEASARTSERMGVARAIVTRGRRPIDRARHELRHEVDSSRRRLQADYLDHTVGPDAATDALLDGRAEPAGRREPHTAVPDPVAEGRRRTQRRTHPVVDRMRRSYRPPRKPWEA